MSDIREAYADVATRAEQDAITEHLESLQTDAERQFILIEIRILRVRSMISEPALAGCCEYTLRVAQRMWHITPKEMRLLDEACLEGFVSAHMLLLQLQDSRN